MTERYAIQELKRMRTPYNREAIDMAIVALEIMPEILKANGDLMKDLVEQMKEEA